MSVRVRVGRSSSYSRGRRECTRSHPSSWSIVTRGAAVDKASSSSSSSGDGGEAESGAVLRGGVSIRRRPPGGNAAREWSFGLGFTTEVGDESEPRNILEEIVWYKDGEVTKMKAKQPLMRLMQVLPAAPPVRNFLQALRDKVDESGRVPALIAEAKKASPSKGLIQPDFDPAAIAAAYEAGGAACVSVLTDSKYFMGSFENLKLIRDAGVNCPLLCKEFIIEGWQVFKARSMGADAFLLIAAVLPNEDLQYFINLGKKVGMTALVEVHTAEEMERVLDGVEGLELVGINNRDLETFEVDLYNTQRILSTPSISAKIKEKDILVVGESGIFTKEDVEVMWESGCRAVLIGESLVRAEGGGKGGGIEEGTRALLSREK